MVDSHQAPPPGSEPPKGDVVEKRLKPTLIRRRAKAEATIEEAPATPAATATTAAPAASQSVAPTTSTGTPITNAILRTPRPDRSEKPAVLRASDRPVEVRKAQEAAAAKPQPTITDKFPAKETKEKEFVKKSTGKKKSRDEWVMEDIKKAGGLLQFAESIVGGPEEEEVVAPVVAVPEKVERVERVFEPSLARRRKTNKREFKKTKVTLPSAGKRVIKIDQSITISDLSQAMGVKGGELIKKLMGMGMMLTINQSMDIDTATLIATEYGFEVEKVGHQEEKLLAQPKTATQDAAAVARPPVVTVMGHVDHGKTSILDVIRKADVVSGEAGGITQHIGAYDVHHKNGTVTFLDTPGHEAFTAMRARGAKVTDFVILVVAADDGVMPQTKEAIAHARAANVPIIVAINKIDKPDANPDRVKRELAENNVVTEDWGGDAICVPTSAKTKQGIDQLLDMILLQAEVLELKANPEGPGEGTIVEARLDKGRGPVATLLVQNGTVRVGDAVVCGVYSGRVRALVDSHGQSVKEAGPSIPVEVIGLDGVPLAGDSLHVTSDDKVAKEISENRARVLRDTQMAASSRVTLEDLHRQMTEGIVQNLNLIVKADVFGSAEVIYESVSKLSNEKAKVSILHKGVGGITESDVMLAAASNAVIVGFHVVPDAKASRLAAQHKVEIKSYSIIYDMVDSIRKAMEGLLAPTLTEKILGRLEVRQAFNVSKIGTVAGCMVTSGKITRASKLRLVRDSVVVFTGDVSSLKRFKDDAKEVAEGYECGVSIANYNDVKPGDIIESFIIEQTATKLG